MSDKAENRIGEMITDMAIQRDGYAKRWIVEQIDTSYLPSRKRIFGIFKTEERAKKIIESIKETNNIKYEVYSIKYDEYPAW